MFCRSTYSWIPVIPVLVLFAACSAASAQEDGRPGEGKSDAARRKVNFRFIEPESSDYWIGVACKTVSQTLAAQLDLEGGLVIERVVPETPAAKAGLQQHDVLVRVNDQQLRSISTLTDAVAKAQDKEKISLEILRGGKPLTVSVPAARKPQKADEASPPVDKSVRQWLGGFGLSGVDLPADYRFVQPGFVLDDAPLPDNVTITVRKQGKAPAEITVKRGNKQWEVSEQELDQLPSGVRAYVTRMLGRGLAGHPAAGRRLILNLQPRLLDRSRVFGGRDVERRLEELNERMDALQKAVESLKKEGSDE